MSIIKLALLDMNNHQPNQGMRNIKEISKAFSDHSEETVHIEIFDVRHKNEIPNVEDFDIFISSGGPGNPHPEGHNWEQPYFGLLSDIWEHNLKNENKKYLFLICHSFQMASIHWNIGNICKRKSYSFGIMPVHKTEDGENDFLLKNLPEPFYAVDSRAYQFIEPDLEKMENLGMKIVAIEKFRPHINLERAVMAIRFSDEIFGTQFHPEADAFGMMENLKEDKNRLAMIENYGEEKFKEVMDRIDDPDKIILTQAQILPRFLQYALENITQFAMV